ARKRVAAQETYCRNSVQRNGYPHFVHLRELQHDVTVLDPYRGALSGHSFNSSDPEGLCIYPDLPKYQAFFLALRDDAQYILRNKAEVLLPEKNEIVIRSVDVSIMTFPHRLGFLLQKIAHYLFCPCVAAGLEDLECLF